MPFGSGTAGNSLPRGGGLLPWQAFLVFAILGLAATEFTVPALVAASLFSLGLFLTGSKSTPAMAVAFFVLGWLVGVFSLSSPPPLDPSELPEWMAEREEVMVQARVERVHPKPEDRIQIILERPLIEREGQKERLSKDLVWNWYSPERMPSPGDKLHARFRLEPVRGDLNPGTWDTRLYWARQGVGYRTSTEGSEGIKSWERNTSELWQTRQDIVDSVRENTPQGAGSGILLALLCGEKSDLSYSQLDLIRRASLSHVLAQSGLHLGFLVGLGWIMAHAAGWLRPGIYLYLPRLKLMVVLTLPLALIYLWLGDFRPSLLRASLMFVFWGILLWRGRGSVLLDGLLAALVVIVLVWPLGIFDLSLQLSVTAVAGIVLFWPLISGWLHNRLPAFLQGAAPFYFLSILGISLVVNAALLPLFLWYFGMVSPHLYLNLLWIPVVGFVVMPAGLAGLASLWLPGLEAWGAWLLHAAALVLQQLFSLLQAMDGAGWLEVLITYRPRWPEMLGYWTLLAWLLLIWRHGVKKTCLLGVCAFVLLLAPSLYSSLLEPSRVNLSVFDVGQGQSLLVETPQKRVLIDGGGSWVKDYDVGRLVLSPALSWGRYPSLDRVVLTHPHYDHVRGLYYILQNYRVQRFSYNGQWPQGWDGRRLRRIIRQEEISHGVLKPGEEIDLGGRKRLEVLHSGVDSDLDPNDASLVLRLVAEDKGLALLPGDVEQEGIDRLLSGDRELEAQVLILPHHGSSSSKSRELYREVDPEIAVASCGYLNHFRFPHSSVESALQERDIPLLSTAKNGKIRIDWELSSLQRDVSVYRGEKELNTREE